jgi:hypothetical protein
MTRLAGAARGFGAFWWDFIVGDDWLIAAGIVIALAATAAVAHNTAVAVWWLVPVAVPVVFGFSLWRAVRHRG